MTNSFGEAESPLLPEGLHVTLPEGISRQGLAAYCLYGQEFGFTMEDVSDERETAAELELYGRSCRGTVVDNDKASSLLARAQRHRDRADRIEALLPPEEK